ncbi:MAG TPA: purine nucleoside permease [Candidatus Didemnitutus sp.]|nr:purine nucleoside permease [Candidatus Didemnitutus sp.]
MKPIPVLIFIFSALVLRAAPPSAPIPVRMVVVATFEEGQDTGDKPGEFQYWVEREHLDQTIVVPGVDHPVRTDGKGLLGVVSGTTSRSGLQIEALVLDPRFDFSHAYWMLAGIAGVDPHDASIGSAAWARYVVDGDIACEIDPRELPADWSTGILVIGADKPNTRPPPQGWEPDMMAFELNPRLVERAYSLSKDVTLMDTPEMQKYRATYTGFPNAQKPPFVLMGEVLGSNRYWHGEKMTQWANDWVKLMTNGKGNFVMTAMEDQGVSIALHRLAKMGKVDFNRFLVLRTASNYCMPAPGQSVVQSLTAEYAGGGPAFEAEWRVGTVMVHEILGHWDTYGPKAP